MPQLRMFIAIETPENVAGQLQRLIERLQTIDAPVRWVKPGQMHWTIKFLGDVDMLETAQVCQRMQEVAAQFEPIELTVQGLGAFPTVDRPRTLWIGSTTGNEAMEELHAALDASLGVMGFNREQRRFTPHLTLGRVRGTKNIDQLNELLEAEAEFLAGSMWADEMILFSSDLQSTGPVYEVVGRAPFGGGVSS